MKIAIMSDSHDAWDYLSQAARLAEEKNCKYLLHAGDIIGPGTVKVIKKYFTGELIYVFGNNDGDRARHVAQSLELEKVTVPDGGNSDREWGSIWEDEIAGVNFFMNHYRRISELAAKSNEFDVVIYGHDHVYADEKIGKTLLLNPGEICGIKNQATFMIFDTESKTVEKIIL